MTTKKGNEIRKDRAKGRKISYLKRLSKNNELESLEKIRILSKSLCKK